MKTGTDEHLQCIAALTPPSEAERITIDGKKGVCLGFKFSVSYAMLPYRTTDDGYVLTLPDGEKYLPVTKAELSELQASHQVATPLPTYEVPLEWRLAQSSLWVLIAFVLLVAGIRFWFRRRVKVRRETAAIVTTGPVLSTQKDRDLSSILRPLLRGDETITHQAYGHDRDPRSVSASAAAHEYFIGVTEQRFIWISQKMGVLGMGRGDQETGELARAEVSHVDAKNNVLTMRASDGTPYLELHVPLIGSGYTRENQIAFLADVPRLIAALPPQT